MNVKVKHAGVKKAPQEPPTPPVAEDEALEAAAEFSEPTEEELAAAEDIVKETLNSEICDEDEAIEFTVPGKRPRKVVMGEPSISLFEILHRVYANSNEQPSHEVTALLYVRQINDQTIPPLKTMHDLQALRRMLGNRGIIHVVDKWMRHFNFKTTDVPVVKKNLR